jgi:hypothetical protein
VTSLQHRFSRVAPIRASRIICSSDHARSGSLRIE